MNAYGKTPDNPYAKGAIAAAVVVIAAVVGINLLPGSGGEGPVSAAVSPSPPPSQIPDTRPPSPTPTPAAAYPPDGLLDGGSYSLTVDGVSFSFSAPPAKPMLDELAFTEGWAPFGSLLISRNIVGPQGAEAVIYWAGFPDGAFADPCGNIWGVSPGAVLLAAAVATAPGTAIVAGPSDVTVGGRAAKHVVLNVRERLGCDPGFFYNWKAQTGGAFWLTTDVGDTIKVWIVDVDGTLLFIAGEIHKDSGAPGEGEVGRVLDQEIQQIVDSIQFDADREYILRAADICEAANARFEMEGSNQLEDSGAWSEAAARISEEVLAELRALPVAAADNAVANRVNSLIEQMIDVLHKQATAASAGDTGRLQMLDLERVDLKHAIDGVSPPGLYGCPVRMSA